MLCLFLGAKMQSAKSPEPTEVSDFNPLGLYKPV